MGEAKAMADGDLEIMKRILSRGPLFVPNAFMGEEAIERLDELGHIERARPAGRELVWASATACFLFGNRLDAHEAAMRNIAALEIATSVIDRPHAWRVDEATGEVRPASWLRALWQRLGEKFRAVP